MLEEYQFPTYRIRDEMTLHITPSPKNKLQLTIIKQGKNEICYVETISREGWKEGKRRSCLAERMGGVVAHEIGYPENELKAQIEHTLNEAAIEATSTTEFDDRLRSSEFQSLLDRTQDVSVAPVYADPTWLVEIAPTDNSPVDDSKCFGFNAKTLQGSSPDSFRKMHLRMFVVDIQIDNTEWRKVADAWLERAEVIEHEAEELEKIPEGVDIHVMTLENK